MKLKNLYGITLRLYELLDKEVDDPLEQETILKLLAETVILRAQQKREEMYGPLLEKMKEKNRRGN